MSTKYVKRATSMMKTTRSQGGCRWLMIPLLQDDIPPSLRLLLRGRKGRGVSLRCSWLASYPAAVRRELRLLDGAPTSPDRRPDVRGLQRHPGLRRVRARAARRCGQTIPRFPDGA